MTQTKKRAIGSLIIWGLVATGFVVVFFGEGGPATFGNDTGRIISAAILIGSGFLLYLGLLFFTRSRRGSGPVIVDERDESIARRANGGTLVVVLVVVYLVCIGLWELYREANCVPIGWMWFLGYFTVMLGNLTHAIATLVLHLGAFSHGQG